MEDQSPRDGLSKCWSSPTTLVTKQYYITVRITQLKIETPKKTTTCVAKTPSVFSCYLPAGALRGEKATFRTCAYRHIVARLRTIRTGILDDKIASCLQKCNARVLLRTVHVRMTSDNKRVVVLLVEQPPRNNSHLFTSNNN